MMHLYINHTLTIITWLINMGFYSLSLLSIFFHYEYRNMCIHGLIWELRFDNGLTLPDILFTPTIIRRKDKMTITETIAYYLNIQTIYDWVI